MTQTLKKVILLLLIAGISIRMEAQSGILNRQDILFHVRKTLSHMYNYEFDSARHKLEIIRKEIADHPVVPFMEALIVYWENYPLRPEMKESSNFIRLMEETIKRAEEINDKHPEDKEAIFFSLFGKAFYAMYWADNGRSNKVFQYLPSLYRLTMEGRKMKDEFIEFYFSSGLYNYYIEAYPEKHPIYKPISYLFSRGNRDEGLKELEYCAENAVYLRIEARYFLSLLYFAYEKDPGRASEFAASLYREFPKNSCYLGNYAFMLLIDQKFPMAELIIKRLEGIEDSFSTMQAHILKAYYLEKYHKDFRSSLIEYQAGLQSIEQYGETVHSLRAMAMMGIGRHYWREGDMNKANKYFRQAKNMTSYDYLIDDK